MELVKAISPVKKRCLVLEKPTVVCVCVCEESVSICELRDCFN